VFRSAGRLRPPAAHTTPTDHCGFFHPKTEAQITNPYLNLRTSEKKAQYIRLLPNVFGEVTILKGLKFRAHSHPT